MRQKINSLRQEKKSLERQMNSPGYNKTQIKRMDDVNSELRRLELQLKHKTGELKTVAFKMPKDRDLIKDLHAKFHEIKKDRGVGQPGMTSLPWSFRLGKGDQEYVVFTSTKQNDPAVKEMIALAKQHAISPAMRGVDQP